MAYSMQAITSYELCKMQNIKPGDLVTCFPDEAAWRFDGAQKLEPFALSLFKIGSSIAVASNNLVYPCRDLLMISDSEVFMILFIKDKIVLFSNDLKIYKPWASVKFKKICK